MRFERRETRDERRDSRSSNEPRNGSPFFQVSIFGFRLSNLAFRASHGKGNRPAGSMRRLDFLAHRPHGALRAVPEPGRIDKSRFQRLWCSSRIFTIRSHS